VIDQIPTSVPSFPVTFAFQRNRGDKIASIGVLTHPAHRSRGCGKAVVTAAMFYAFERGHVVLYQMQPD